MKIITECDNITIDLTEEFPEIQQKISGRTGDMEISEDVFKLYKEQYPNATYEDFGYFIVRALKKELNLGS